MKTQVVCSAATADELQKMINEYFYSKSYIIHKGTYVLNEKTREILSGYFVREKNGRFQFCREA